MSLMTQPATHYAAPMTAIEDGLAALKRIADLEDTMEDARAARDDAIWRAHKDDGMTPPEIHRALNQQVSLSLVRHAITLQKRAAKARRRK